MKHWKSQDLIQKRIELRNNFAEETDAEYGLAVIDLFILLIQLRHILSDDGGYVPLKGDTMLAGAIVE